MRGGNNHPAFLPCWRHAMTIRQVFFVLIPGLVLAGHALPADKDSFKSGPQAGDNLPGPFHSLVAFSEEPSLVGKKNDFFEMYGSNPVILVFARDLTKPLTKLVNKL